MTQITRFVVCTLRRPNVGLDEFGIRTKVLNAANGALLPLAEELGAALCLGEPARTNPIAVSRVSDFLVDWGRVQLMDGYFQERVIEQALAEDWFGPTFPRKTGIKLKKVQRLRRICR